MIVPSAPADEVEQIREQIQGVQKQLNALLAQERALQQKAQDLQKQLDKEAAANKVGYLKVEVKGLLIWKDSRYRIVVKPQEDLTKELELVLWLGEGDKSLLRHVDGLKGKQVVATGSLIWLGKDHVNAIRSDDDYVLAFDAMNRVEFEIKEALKKKD